MTKNYLKRELEDHLKNDLGIFRFIENHTLDGLWYWDLENQENEYMNPRFWEILGYNPDEKSHSPSEWMDIIDPEDLQTAQINIEKHLSDPSHPYDHIVRYKHASGKDVWVRCRGIAIRDSDGKPIRFLGCHNDVTELKLQEQRANSLLSSYRALVDTNSIFYIKTDVMGNYTFANDCFLEHYGYDPNTIIGSPSLNTIFHDDHPKTYEVVSKCFETPNTPHEVVIRKPYADGRIRAERFEFYGVTDNDGNVVEIACIGTNVSDLLEKTNEIKKLLEVQTDKNERLQQHSYITSHNIRHSVANIKGLFEMVESHPEGFDSYMKMLKTSVEALDQTISNLNTLLNQEKQAEYAKLKEVRVVQVVERALGMEQMVIDAAGVDVQLNIDPDARINTIPPFFDSIVHNLISNALKYGMPDNQNNRLQVNWEEEGGKRSLEVKDFGQGFDLPHNAELLFRMGTRLNRETLGDGLGLFIVKHQVEMIGADIVVNSNKGEGASFKIVWNG